jgi:hypothetical protein
MQLVHGACNALHMHFKGGAHIYVLMCVGFRC